MQGACKVPGSDTSIEVALMPSQIRMPGGRTLGILILSRPGLSRQTIKQVRAQSSI